MMVLTQASGMTIDRDIEGRIGQGEVNALVLQQDRVSIRLPSVRAKQPM